MHDDGEERDPVERPLHGERLAAGCECRRPRRDAPGAIEELGRRADDGIRRARTAGATRDQGKPTIGAVKNGDANVAPGLSPVFVVDRRDVDRCIARSPGRGDRVDEHIVHRLGVHDSVVYASRRVLHLLKRDQVGRAQIARHDRGEAAHFRRGAL